jgi:hypothetical protein
MYCLMAQSYNLNFPDDNKLNQLEYRPDQENCMKQRCENLAIQKDAFHVSVFDGSDLHTNNKKRLRKQFLTANASIMSSSSSHASAIEMCSITVSSYGSRHDWLYSIPCFSTSHDILCPKSLTCQCHIFPLHKSLLPCLLQTFGS